MGFKIKNGVLLKYEGTGALERLGIRKQDETLTVPKNVTQIADEAFTMTEISSISIPSSVAAIGERSFSLCAELHTVAFTEGLREIGINAFDGCHVLRSAALPDSIHSIGAWAFCNCSGLRSVSIPEHIDTIARGTFSGCSKLEELTIPGNVKYLDNRAFYACTSLVNLTLSKGLKTIGREAFACCSSLATVYIPETVTEICEDAFAGCSELRTVVIPPSVTKLHPYAFGTDSNVQTITTVTGSVAHQYAQMHGIMCYTEREANLLRGCNPAFFIEYGVLKKYTQEYNVRDIMIPEGVIRIGKHAFEQNRQLVSIVVPEGVVDIDNYAFNGCRSLQRIYLPSTLKSIGKFAFRDCPLLEVILPQGIETVERNAFQGCTSLRRFYMPDTLKKLENEALRDCMSLTALQFSANTEIISDSVCSGCSSLRRVVIPEGPKYIHQNAFRGCSSLQEIYIPDSVQEISGNAFADTPLFRMTAGHYIVGRFLIKADGYSPIPVGVHRIGPRAFERGGLRQAVIPEGVISIGDNAFSNCGVLTNVIIPKTVTEIGVDAFANTPWMSRRTEPFTIAGANILMHANISQPHVTIQTGVRCIGPSAFAQLRIMHITVPEGVLRLQHGAFSYCEQLEIIELPSTLRQIDGYIFHGCTKLKIVKFREGPTKIGHAMFSSCVSLKKVKLPGTLTEIENEAFYHSGIEKIIIPDGVTRIGQSAFSHCDSLTDVVIPASVTDISENAFTECPKFRLHAEEGSFAERYAKQHHMMMTLVPLNMDAMLAEIEDDPEDEPVMEQPAAPKKNRGAQMPGAMDPDFLFQSPAEEAAEPQEEDIPEKAMGGPINPDFFDNPMVPDEEPDNPPQAATDSEQVSDLPAETDKVTTSEDTEKITEEKQEIPEEAAPKPEADVPEEAAETESSKEEKEKPEPQPEKKKVLSFVEEEEMNYAERVKRELEEARKKSVPVDPKAKLPQVTVKKEKAAKPIPKQKVKHPKKELTEEEKELALRAKETPEETKARRRAKLLDDLPDVDDMPARKPKQSAAHKEQPAASRPEPLPIPEEEGAFLTDEEPDIPKLDKNLDSVLPNVSEPADGEDPFADIHWNDEQTTFTIRF
ncbi:MAG: leucine-rich repeat domain-containing protein [Oscillospiraceae bacterium]|nr:leucine-rich repeat domain-containing protein [Oscillospiraceae bacterium]